MTCRVLSWNFFMFVMELFYVSHDVCYVFGVYFKSRTSIFTFSEKYYFFYFFLNSINGYRYNLIACVYCKIWYVDYIPKKEWYLISNIPKKIMKLLIRNWWIINYRKRDGPEMSLKQSKLISSHLSYSLLLTYQLNTSGGRLKKN